ncbi:MAG: hypothetical protein ACR2NO_05860 [Chloroflexota bacterium]
MRLDTARGGQVVGATCAAWPETPLLDHWWCGYEADGETWSDAPRGRERSFGLGRARVTVHPEGVPSAPYAELAEVVAEVVAPQLRIAKRFTVYRDLPFVRVRYAVETTGVEGRGPGLSVSLPGLAFTNTLADAFDLAEDTADDGLDLGGGLALPAWRAFGDAAGDAGVLVFAADRRVMSRLQVTGRGCAFRPPYYLAYSTNVVTTREVHFGLEHQNYGPVDELDWFIGAFHRESLPRLRGTISAFHARRRPGVGGSALEYVPGVSPWDECDTTGRRRAVPLPPSEALPRPWPTTVTLSRGAGAVRHLVLPDTSADWAPVASRAAGVAVTASPEAGRPTRAIVQIAAETEAPTGARTLAVELPGGELEVIVDVVPAVSLPRGDDGRVVGAADLAKDARAAGWLVVDAPQLPGGAALLQRPGGGAGPIHVAPTLRGRYDVYVGVGQGAGVKFRPDGDPTWSYVHTERVDPRERVDIQSWQPVETACRPGAGGGSHSEVLLRRVALDGGGLWLAPHPYLHGYTVVSHLRFVPAPGPEPVVSLSGRGRIVAGLADIPDVGNDLGADAYQEETWREVVAQHARVGIDTVYWRVDGQCADFHTKVGTVRYSVPRTHGLYSPRSRTYGRALELLDPLRIAADEKRRWDLRLIGWMRANNYSGNVVSRFFVEHPEWHEQREDGRLAPQLCFAVPAVRAHKTAILREAVAYGLDGLMIDTLRHPPMVGYHPVVVQAFREECGEDPPRGLDPRRPLDQFDGRDGESWKRWFRFRARYFADLIRELRAGLSADGYGGLPIHVRVAPTRYLHDGADLEALLDERLVDAVIANRYIADPLDYERLFPVVRNRVPIVAICDPIRGDRPQLLHDLHRDSRLAGTGVYESTRVVHTPLFRDALVEIAHHG